MRKLLVAMSIIAFVFGSCGKSGKVEAVESTEGATSEKYQVSSVVAYVDMDTLVSRYEMFKELSGELEAKAKKAEAEIMSKGRSLERGVADLQEKAEKGLVTRAQLGELQEKLARQEQNFYEHRDKVQQELTEENQVMMNNIYHSLKKYMEEFNGDYRYGTIFSTMGGTPILHADPALNITEQVLAGLNAQYAKEKSAKK